LVFGKKTFKDTGLQIGKVGYAKEQKFLLPRVKTKAQLLLWVIIHEWCHLYEGMQEHKNYFFEGVGKKYDWMMLKLNEKI
jgi:predicted metal-dependent hydrolase